MSTPEMPAALKASVEGSKAQYVNLGKSGLKVSIPILGAMSIGTPEWAPWVVGEEEVRFPDLHNPKLGLICKLSACKC